MNRATRSISCVTLFVFTLFFAFSAAPFLGNAEAYDDEPLMLKLPIKRGGGGGCTPDPASILTGKVYEHIPAADGSKTPVSGATVRVKTYDTRLLRICSSLGTTRETTYGDTRMVTYSTTTNSSGVFYVRHLPANVNLHSIEIVGRETRDGRREMQLGSISTYNAGDYYVTSFMAMAGGGEFSVTSSTTVDGTVTGRLLDGTPDDPNDNPIQPLDNFFVLAENENTPWGVNCVNDGFPDEITREFGPVPPAAGNYSFTELGQGSRYYLTASAPGFAPSDPPNCVSLNPNRFADLRFSNSAVIPDITLDEMDTPPQLIVSYTLPIPDQNEGAVFNFTINASDSDPLHKVWVNISGTKPIWLEESLISGQQGGDAIELRYDAVDTANATTTIPFSAVNHQADDDSDADLTLDRDINFTFQVWNCDPADLGPTGCAALGASPRATALFEVRIEDVDQQIVITRADVTVDEGTATNFTATAQDPDTEDWIVIFAKDTGPVWLTDPGFFNGVNPATLDLTANPPAETPMGPHPASLRAVGNYSPAVTHPFNITVLDVEHAPEITGTSPQQNFNMNEGGTQNFRVDARDLDTGDLLTYTWDLQGPVTGAQTTPNGANPGFDIFTFSPAFGEGGSYTLSVTVEDNDATPPGPSYTWNITVNAGATMTSLVQTPDPVTEGQLVSLEATFTDADTPANQLAANIFTLLNLDYMKDYELVNTPTANPGDPVIIRYRGAPKFIAAQSAQQITVQTSDNEANTVNHTLTLNVVDGTAVYVDGSFTNPEGFPQPGNGRGTVVHPYFTVQEGVNLFETSTTGGPAIDTILIRPGTYEETVTLNANLTLRSELGPEVTRLVAPFHEILIPYIVWVDGVTSGGIVGLDLDGRNDSQMLLRLTNVGSAFEVRNNILRRSDSYGVFLEGLTTGGDALILNNLFKEIDDYAVFAKDLASTPSVINNIMVDIDSRFPWVQAQSAVITASHNVIEQGDTPIPAGASSTVLTPAELATFLVGEGDHHLRPTAAKGLNNGNTAQASTGGFDMDGTPIDRGPYGGGASDASGTAIGRGLPWTKPANMVSRAGSDTAALSTEANVRFLNGSRSSYPNGHNAYTWKRGATTIASTPKPLYTPPGVGLDTLTLEISNGVTTVNDTVDITVRSAPRDLYVNATRPDDTGNGLTLATAKKYVSSIMAVAERTDIIHVQPAYYLDSRDAVRMKDGVTLKSEGLQLITLNPNTSAVLAPPAQPIVILADDLNSGTIDGLSIGGNGVTTGWGIVSANSNLKIKHNVVAAMKEIAIAADGGDLTITNNLLIANPRAEDGSFFGTTGFGVKVWNARATINNNTFDSNKHGLDVQYLKDNSSVQNNLVSRNQYGIYCTPSNLSNPANYPLISFGYNASVLNVAPGGGAADYVSCQMGPNDFNNPGPESPIDPNYVDPLTFPENYALVPPYDYHLNKAVSAMDDRGNPAAAFNDRDGSRNDLGVYGGPDLVDTGFPPLAAMGGGTESSTGAPQAQEEPAPMPAKKSGGGSTKFMAE